MTARLRRLSTLFTLAAVAIMATLAVAGAPTLAPIIVRANRTLLVLASAAAAVAFIVDAGGWHLVLRALGQRLPLAASIRIWMLSAVARFLPGGIWGYTSRAALAARDGVPVSVTVASMYLETLLLLVGALAVGMPALGAATGLPLGLPGAIAVLGSAAALLHPAVPRMLGHLPGPVGAAARSLPIPGAGSLLRLGAYYLVFWTAFAAVFALFAVAIAPELRPQALHAGSAFALAFAIGLLAPFAPGGVGVRESVLYLSLLPVAAPDVCLALAVGSRVWLLAVEAVVLALTTAAAGAGRRP